MTLLFFIKFPLFKLTYLCAILATNDGTACEYQIWYQIWFLRAQQYIPVDKSWFENILVANDISDLIPRLFTLLFRLRDDSPGCTAPALVEHTAFSWKSKLLLEVASILSQFLIWILVRSKQLPSDYRTQALNVISPKIFSSAASFIYHMQHISSFFQAHRFRLLLILKSSLMIVGTRLGFLKHSFVLFESSFGVVNTAGRSILVTSPFVFRGHD